MSKKNSNEKQETALVAPQAPLSDSTAVGELADYAEYAGAGFEHQTMEDRAIPFLAVLQGQSKVLESHPELRQGMIYNTVTLDGFDGKDGVSFVPVTTQHVFVEWKPRAQGGGFVAIHQVDEPLIAGAKETAAKLKKEFGKFNTAYDSEGRPVGNDLVDTFYVYGLCLGAEGEDLGHAVIGFTSTGIKKYRAWQTKASSVQIKLADGRRVPAPLFAHRYRLKVESAKNAKGSWYAWDITFDGENAMAARVPVSDPIFQAAVAMKKLIESGQARAAYESQDAGGESAGNGGTEEAPF